MYGIRTFRNTNIVSVCDNTPVLIQHITYFDKTFIKKNLTTSDIYVGNIELMHGSKIGYISVLIRI